MDNTTFFLGANSAQGFYSLYSDFASRPGDMLHIIKAGPGTGKSTFMRKIGQAAEERGYEVEYIICSGDRRGGGAGRRHCRRHRPPCA